MATLVKAVDQALGYTPPASSRTHGAPGHSHDVDASQFFRTLDTFGLSRTGDVQERWIDEKDAYDEFERKKWAEENQQQQAPPPKKSAADQG